MNPNIRELHVDEQHAVAGGTFADLTIAPGFQLRPPPFPYLDVRVKPQPVPWIPGG